MNRTEKIILGIDPGTQILGFGIISVCGPKMALCDLGVINLTKFDNHALKLKHIFEEITALIDKHHPDEFAIEEPFFGKNVQSMLKLGRAQGVAMAAALNRQVPIAEYLPKRVKQAVTGNGNASKHQVAVMMQRILGIPTLEHKLDATDALSVAVCHAMQLQSPLQGISSNSKAGWGAFLKSNPDRVK